MSLKQTEGVGEAKAAQTLITDLPGLAGIPWLFTGDAAFAERPLVESTRDKGGMYLFDLKDNLAASNANAQWAFSLARCDQDSFFEHSAVRKRRTVAAGHRNPTCHIRPDQRLSRCCTVHSLQAYRD